MSVHITRFVDRLQSFEARNAKEFSCSIVDAKNLHRDITRLLSEIDTLRQEKTATEQVTWVELRGGDFG